MAAVEEQTILSIDVIRTDGGTQPRAEVDQDVIRDYAQQMFEGVQFPPVTVYYDGTDYWLADGFHRYYAAKQQCKDILYADVKQGTRRDAVLFSVGANATHGLRRTNDDKRKAVKTLLNDPEWAKWPQTQIAKCCNVTPEYVSRLKSLLSIDRSIDSTQEVTVTRNGTTYTMNTTNIGQHIPQPMTTTDIFESDYTEDDGVDTEPELPVYTPPRYEAPVWTPTLPPSPVPAPAPMPASHYSTYTDEDEEQKEETEEERHQTAVDIRTFTAIDTGALIDYYDELVRDREEQKTRQAQPEPDHFMPLMSSSETPEWYTPLSIIERVQSFFGKIDLDPCSNSHEAPNVPARTLYTKEDDGLAQSWHGSTYMNPPYGGEISKWVKKLLDEYESGNVKEAIALVPGRIDTAWFQPLYEHLICAIKGRVQFIGASTNSAPFPSVAVYLGPRKDDFIQTFKDMGPIVTRIA